MAFSGYPSVERKQLRDLLHQRLIAVRHAATTFKVAALDEEIAELILKSLSLSKREAPSKHSLVAVAFDVLYNCAGSPKATDEPELIWKGWSHANIKTGDWPGSLKDRLGLLCGPLDKALAERLESYKVQPAA